MSTPEFFLQRWEPEQAAFAKVLKAMPTDKLDYRPHERSTSAGDLAWQLVEEQRVLADLIDHGTINWETRPRPSSTDEIVAEWDKHTAALHSRLKTLDAEKSAKSANFNVGGQTAFSESVGSMLWGFLFDMVHHRGQLSTYLRPMGGKVPSIYGPSADDNGQ